MIKKLWRIMLMPIVLIYWLIMTVQGIVYWLLCILTSDFDICMFRWEYNNLNPIELVKNWLEDGVNF